MLGFLATLSVSLIGLVFSSAYRLISATFVLSAVLALRWVIFESFGHLPYVGVLATLSPLPLLVGCVLAEQLAIIPQFYLSRMAAAGMILSAGISLWNELHLLGQHASIFAGSASSQVASNSWISWIVPQQVLQPFFGAGGWLSALSVLDFNLFWACVFNVLAAMVYLLRLGKKWADRGIDRETKSIHGTSTFATRKIIKQKFSDGPLTLGIAKGRAGKVIHSEINGHCLTIAPTGAGKTTSVAIPNALDWNEQLVVFDPKGDLVDIVSEERHRKTGRPFISIDARRNQQSDSINIIDWIDAESSYAFSDADAIASAFFGGELKQTANDKTFEELSKSLLKVGILEVIGNPDRDLSMRTMLEVRSFLTSPGLLESLEKIEDEILRYPNPNEFGQLVGQIISYGQTSEKTFGSVQATLEAATNWLSSPALHPLVCGTTGERCSMQAIRDREVDIYLTIPLRTLEATPEVARAVMSAIFQQYLVAYEEGARSKSRTLFLVDEMPRLKKFDLLESVRDAGRGLGIVLWPMVQDLSQITQYYGKEGRGAWLSSGDIISFFGIRELETAKYISEMLGNRTAFVREHSTTYANAKGLKGIMGYPSKSNQESNKVQSRRLMLAEEIIRMPAEEQIVLKTGVDPIEAGLLRYFEHPDKYSVGRDRKT